MTTQGASATLADFVSDLTFPSLPPAVVSRAKLLVADTIGSMLFGSEEPEVRQAHSAMRLGTAATILRAELPRAADAETAALANALASCFVELDEGGNPTGHPAIHVLPSVLAQAESQHASGQQFVAAFVAGYEVQARLQAACKLRPGIHCHGNLGNPGAAAGLGHLAGWDGSMCLGAMSAAANMAAATSYELCTEGATVRNSYPALTARAAYLTKLLIESGFTSDTGSVEEVYGRLLGLSFDSEKLVDRLGERYLILEGYLKFHAACGLVHPAIEATGAALNAHHEIGTYPPLVVSPIDAADVARIHVRTGARGSEVRMLPNPNSLSAKFSIPWGVASFVVRGRADPDSYSPKALADGGIWKLARLVEVEPDLEFGKRWPGEDAADVEIAFSNGTTRKGVCRTPYGTGANPADDRDTEAKFMALGSRALGPSCQQVWNRIMALEAIEDMATFIQGVTT